MNESDFLSRVYGSISAGDIIKKPKVTARLIAIKKNNDIVYSVGKNQRKSVTEAELKIVYNILKDRKLTTADIRKIVPSSRPCNSTTIKWLLTHSKLASITPDGGYKK